MNECCKIIDGKHLSEIIKDEVRREVKNFISERGGIPSLSVILVGNNEGSKIYVRNKISACEKVGIKSHPFYLQEDVSEDYLLSIINELAKNENIHGILVQLPLPPQINEERVIEAIPPLKDVDGFHPDNFGRLLLGKPRFIPCTPLGIIKILEWENIEIEGKRAVIAGRSNIVGKPVAILLLQRNASVTICHSKTKNLPEIIGESDILVAAIGKKEFIKGEWIKNGSVVIDVGINREENGKLKGDVEFEKAKLKASFITPVPGGVGPMTIAMLLKNTLKAAILQSEKNE